MSPLFNILKFNITNNIRNCCYLTTSSSSLSLSSCKKNEQQSKTTIVKSTNPSGTIATTTYNNTINNNNNNYIRIGSLHQQKTIQQLRNFSHSASVIMSTTTSNTCNNNNKRVLSIQSHVVQGYVGNKSATFPLQVLGFDVDAINSVQFSNHTGYGAVTGQVLSDKELIELFGGLKDNQLLPEYTHLLTGYVGKDSFLQEIGKIVKSLRDVNPNLIYVCDPVMGDNGQMYVPENLLPIYRNEIIPLSDICTPNQYEVELLTGKKIKNKTDIWMAMDWFHDKGVKTIAVSSTDLGGSDTLLAFLSHRKDNQHIQYTLSIPKQGKNIHFTGTGDLFAALFLAHSTISKDLRIALEKTTATLQSVIQNTINGIPEEIKRKNSSIPPQYLELKLVKSKNDIENPNVVLFAKSET